MLLFLLHPIFGQMEAMKSERAVFIRFHRMSVHLDTISFTTSVAIGQNRRKIGSCCEMKLY